MNDYHCAHGMTLQSKEIHCPLFSMTVVDVSSTVQSDLSCECSSGTSSYPDDESRGQSSDYHELPVEELHYCYVAFPFREVQFFNQHLCCLRTESISHIEYNN